MELPQLSSSLQLCFGDQDDEEGLRTFDSSWTPITSWRWSFAGSSPRSSRRATRTFAASSSGEGLTGGWIPPIYAVSTAHAGRDGRSAQAEALLALCPAS
jgi:hypothetical protein